MFEVQPSNWPVGGRFDRSAQPVPRASRSTRRASRPTTRQAQTAAPRRPVGLGGPRSASRSPAARP